MNSGKSTTQNLKTDHPAYIRYPFLNVKYGVEREYMFAWLPKKTVSGKWVWLTKILKTTHTTRRSIVPKPNVWYKKTAKFKKTVYYETHYQVAQRVLSNEN
jgi:hypothetical protein